ncbi:MAG: hypothetical protein R6X16_03315 [Anaerolineae bacterium]
MRRRKELAILMRVVVLALVIGAVITAPVQADPAGKVKGAITGLALTVDPAGNPALYESQYIWNIHQVGDGEAAMGYSTSKMRTTQTEWTVVKFEFDCLRFFATEDGRSAAIYSGRIVRAQQPDWVFQMFGDWVGRLGIGMVIDGGPEGLDEVYFWSPEGTFFYPDEGAPLACVVPEGSLMIPFFVTGGDVEVRMP